MNQAEERRSKIDRVVQAIKNYVVAEISYMTTEQDLDSLGPWHEERELREALEEVLL